MSEEFLLAAIKRRKARDRWFTSLVVALGIFSLLPLFSVLFYVVSRGGPGLFSIPVKVAAAGTLLETALAMLFAVPFGVGLGLYLSDACETKKATVIRHIADLLASTPTIIVGMAVYAVVVVIMGTFSLFAGSVALAVLTVPFLARETEKKISLRAHVLREGALALGASRMQAWLQMVLPALRRPITVAVLLSALRAMGETAPLLFTSYGNRSWPAGFFSPAPALPLQIYNAALSSHTSLQAQAFAGGLALVIFIFALYGLARWMDVGDRS